jgi:uncharacterized membrane protein/transglutaminase-like putative cysteine protease
MSSLWRFRPRRVPNREAPRRPQLPWRRRLPLYLEPLEDRILLDAGLPQDIIVGRTLSAYSVSDVQNNQLAITYTAYNEQANPVTGVLLTDTLQPGVTFSGASQLPDRNGQAMAWSLGTIPGFDRTSVTLTVSLTNPTPLLLDTGAQAFATLDAGAVSDATPAATLRQGSIAPNLLASTPDANTTDPFVQEQAAKLDYNAQRIFDFLHNDVGYNSYSGSLRGARGTLWSSAGNALDVASLGVALMRGSGIPAQYVSGTLAKSQAQQLILSMFPASFQTVGYIPTGTPTTDPANDPQLLVETESHYWLQFDAGSGMKDGDPLVAGATIGQTFTSVTGTFAEVPDNLRQKTEVKLTAETYSRADALFGFGLSDTVVLHHAFNDVDLVGRPLTIGNLVTSSATGALIISAQTHTYTPYIVQGDDALLDSQLPEAILGQQYQEVFTDFPLTDQIITGLFLDVTLNGPGNTLQTFTRPLVDRIGYTTRQELGIPNVSVDPNGPPVITAFDLTTLNILSGLQSPAAAQLVQERANEELASISTETDPTVVAQTDALIALARAELTCFAVASDQETANLASVFSVAAYFDAPRITAFASKVVTNNDQSTVSFSFDLRRDSVVAFASPGQNVQAPIGIASARGLFDSFLEAEALPSVPAGQTLSAATVVLQAMQQGIPLAGITASNLSVLQSLDLSAVAMARITANVENGLSVIVPTRALTVHGTQTAAWLNVSPTTGEIIAQSEDGGNQSITTYAAVQENNSVRVNVLVTNAEGATSRAAFNFSPRVLQAAKKNADQAIARAGSGEGLGKLVAQEALRAALSVATAAGDPPLVPEMFNLNVPFPTTPRATSSMERAEQANQPPGQVGGTVQVSHIAAAGNISASWTSAATSSFLAFSLGAAIATVLDSRGTAVGSGRAAFTAQTSMGVSISGPALYSVNGSGSLSFYRPAENTLAVSGNWDHYSATVSGNVSISLTVPAGMLTLNGQPLPAGRYTITASSATLSGRGPSTSPNFSGSVSITATNSSVNLGSGSGPVTIGGNQVDLTGGAALSGYTGSITVAAGGNSLDDITFSGNAGHALTVRATPNNLTADQNAPMTFMVKLNTSFADTYNLTAQAPPGWTVTIDNNGNVSATPASGLQRGVYPIKISAQSTTNPDLVGQTSVNVTITATQPGITLAVNADPIFTVPFNGAQVPTAFQAVIHNNGPTPDAYNLTFPNIPAGFTLLNSGTRVTIPAGQTGIVGLYLQPSGQIPSPGTQESFTVTATSTSNPAITATQTLTFTVPAIHAVTLSVDPPAVSTIPGVGVQDTLTLTAVGNVPENIAVTANGPSGLAVGGVNTPVALSVGQSASQVIGLTPTADTSLNSTLTAAISYASALAADVVSVLSVAPAPNAVAAGQSVDVSATVFDGVSQARPALASYTLKNSAGTVVFSSTAVSIQLNAVAATSAVRLGNLSTTGLAPGAYTVAVTLTEQDGSPIAGATGQGLLLIDAPVTATLRLDTNNLPPGNGTVTNTLTVASQPTVGTLATSGVATSVAVIGTLAYVGGTQGIDIVDVSKPYSPQLLSTFGESDVVAGGSPLVRQGTIGGKGYLLVGIQATGHFDLLIYTLGPDALHPAASPTSPQLISRTPFHFASIADLLVQGNTVVVPTAAYVFNSNGELLNQAGTVLAIDVSNPAAPALASVLFNDPNQPPGLGGANPHLGGVLVNSQVAYIASTTATGSDNQTGVGRLLVVNGSDPRNLSVAGMLDIPGTAVLYDVAVQGNRALVVGSSGGVISPGGGFGGNVTLSVLDITDPLHPQFLGTTLVTAAQFAANRTEPFDIVTAEPLGGGQFAVSGTIIKDRRVLLTVDASNPSNLVVSTLAEPSLVNQMAAAGGLLYTTNSAGLGINRAGALAGIPVTAKVQVPSGTGVAVVANSFSLAPTQILHGATFDTLIWNLTLAPGSAGQTLTWQSAVSNLQPGEVRPVALNPIIDFTSLGTADELTLTPTVVAGVPTTQTIQIPVRVVVPGADAIANAAVSAGQLNNGALANRLNDLSTALTNLVQDPANAIYKSQALASLDSIIRLLAADPVVSDNLGGLTDARGALAAAATTADLQAAVSDLGSVLASLALRLADEAAHGLTLSLRPNSRTVFPSVPADFPLVLQNIGSQPTTYDLSVTGLPASVTGVFVQNGHPIQKLTLQPGQRIDGGSSGVTLELTETSGSLFPTGFAVTATAEAAPEISQTAAGSLSVRASFVNVTEVAASPPFTNPGAPVSVTAKVLNAVNQQQTAQASFTVTDPAGQVLFSSSPVSFTLTVQAALATVDLGSFPTTGLALGSYVIQVSVTDVSGMPLPGGTGQGTVLIGTPVTGSLSVSPNTLPPGTGMVTNALSIASQLTLPDPLTLVGQVQTTPLSTTVALGGNLAYVAGTNGIDIVDVGTPSHPQLLSTFGQTDIVQNGLTIVRQDTIGGTSYLLVGTTASTNAGMFSLLVYSLAAGPLNPQLVSNTPFAYEFMNEMLVQGTTVLVPTFGYEFDFFGDITDQFGSVLAIDVGDPAAPTLGSVLFNSRPAPRGGDTPQFGGVLVNNQTAYIASTTSTGTDFMNGDFTSGVGRVLVVDSSNPGNVSVLRAVDIPGTVNLFDVTVQGNRALVVGSSGGAITPGGGFAGHLTLSLLDITDPLNPLLLGTTLVTDTKIPSSDTVAKLSALPLGNGLFAVSQASLNGNPVLLLVDPADPDNIVVTSDPVPALVNEMAVSGDLLYTTSSAGLLIYRINAIPSIPITASVQVPNNTGVAVVAGSFDMPPTKVVHGTSFDTLVWVRSLAFGEAQPTFTWQSTVSGLQSGEVRDVTLGATVNFRSQGTPGTLSLSPTRVTGARILGLSPASRTVAPAATASYTVTVTNPEEGADTFFLSVLGVPDGWVNVPAFVQVDAKSSTTVTLALTSDALAALGDYGFTVTADNHSGAADSVSGDLVLAGQPPVLDTEAHGVVLTLTPAQGTGGQGTPASYVVQVTNTGSADEAFSLSVTGLPAGVQAVLSQADVDVPPGASNVRDVTLTLTPLAGTPTGNLPFLLTATSVADASVAGTASGTLVVLANGVRVSLNPPSGAPGDTFQMTVTNTGTVADTFDLAVAGPAGLVATLGTAQVMLAPGASQAVSITTTAVNFAIPGSLNLVGIATSRAHPAVRAAGTARLGIVPRQGLAAHFDPAAQVLPVPGTSSFLLLVDNTGNVEDDYTATIQGTSGPIKATLMGLDGQPTQTIPVFRLPGLSTGAILLQTNLGTAGQGNVTVQVQSLSNAAMTSTATARVRAGAVEPPPPPPPPPMGPECGPDPSAPLAVQFIQQVYCDLFDRALDPSGMVIWPGLLAVGRSRAEVVADILTSTPALEYRHAQVQDLYTRLLHRAVDPSGLAGGVDFLQAGGTVEQLAAAVAGSDEFFQQNGGSTDGFLQALYRDGLGRAIDDPGRVAFAQALAAGAGRAQVAAVVFGSAEYRTDLVRDLYRRFLRREAADAEAAAFVAALGQGARDEDVLATVLGSPEYYQRTLGTAPTPPATELATAYVTALYRQVLGREPDGPGLAGWVQSLAGGGSRAAVARAFWESAEHRGLEVDALYARYLRRAADADGRALWVSALQRGASEADVAAQLLISAEYAGARADSSAFVEGLYADVLGRSGDAGGLAFWRSALDGGVSRAAVARAFLTSAEADRRALDDYYARFLGRGPDPGGEQSLLAALAGGGATADQVAEAFLASQEFFARAAAM